jgi:hypothetical protein
MWWFFGICVVIIAGCGWFTWWMMARPMGDDDKDLDGMS